MRFDHSYLLKWTGAVGTCKCGPFRMDYDMAPLAGSTTIASGSWQASACVAWHLSSWPDQVAHNACNQERHEDQNIDYGNGDVHIHYSIREDLQ